MEEPIPEAKQCPGASSAAAARSGACALRHAPERTPHVASRECRTVDGEEDDDVPQARVDKQRRDLPEAQTQSNTETRTAGTFITFTAISTQRRPNQRSAAASESRNTYVTRLPVSA